MTDGAINVATHALRRQKTLQVITGGACFVAGVKAARSAEPLDQAADRLFVMEDLVDLSNITVGWQHGQRNCVLRDVHPQVNKTAMRNTGHGRFLLPYVGSVRRSTRMIHEDAAVGEPAVPC